MRSNVLPFKLLFRVITILFVIFSKNVQAQLANFDSVKTVVSSADYDYKNPVFDASRGELFQSLWMAYERYKLSGASDIAVRKVTYQGYDSEILLTSSVADSNINPYILDKFAFWESNRDGNRNICYSIFNGSWSAPAVLPGSTTQDETQPCLSFNYAYPIQFSFYPLVFKRGSDIFMKTYIPATGLWDTTEYNVTDSISEDCSKPLIYYESTDFGIVFLKKISDGNYKLNLRRFHMYNNGVISWLNKYEYEAVVPMQTMKLSRAFTVYNQMPAFDSGTVNKKVMMLRSSLLPSAEALTNPIQGSNSTGKGVMMGIITDNPAALYFSGFGCVSRRNDSTFIALQKQYNTSASSSGLKRKYIGDASVTTQLDLTQPLYAGNYYKVRAVWERKINGKWALEESTMTDVVGGISETGEAADYRLLQNYPNPFNPGTVIRYQLSVAGNVSLKIFDLLGKEVASLVNEKQSAGSYAVDFNSAEYNLSSGIYFYTLNAGEFKETKKMVLVK
ncbi:MAG: T9SS type A sorting domain-containing protein [Ignavibacteria bacterium]|nr:T9SS type A sorting domain-containing protein [Ignavibacteria bacterium]